MWSAAYAMPTGITYGRLSKQQPDRPRGAAPQSGGIRLGFISAIARGRSAFDFHQTAVPRTDATKTCTQGKRSADR